LKNFSQKVQRLVRVVLDLCGKGFKADFFQGDRAATMI
jgi:hypothetical protein